MLYRMLAFAFSLTMCLGAVSNSSAQVSQVADNQETDTRTLRVMSFNIHHGADKDERDRLDEMARVITESRSDLVGLQEVDIGCNRSGKVDQMKRLAKLTDMHPAYAEHFPYDGGSYGLGLLSKFPLTNIKNDRIPLNKKDGTTETRALLSATAVLPNGDQVSIATVHMALDQPSRMRQAEEIIRLLKKDAMPVILTGDLNAEPGTKEILLLETAFTDMDTTDKLTFPVDKPIKKIDYIFVTENLGEVVDHQVLTDQQQSDHLPVVGAIQLK